MNWINVNDKLPEDKNNNDIPCLVYCTCWGIVVRPFNQHHNCWDCEDGDDYYADAIGGKITHWQPLPELPK